jgi:hypothetical protein
MEGPGLFDHPGGKLSHVVMSIGIRVVRQAASARSGTGIPIHSL